MEASLRKKNFNRRMKRMREKKNRRSAWIVGGVGIALAAAIVVSSITIIPTGYTGVRTTFGQVSQKPLTSGLSLKIPLIQSVEKVNNRQQDIVFHDRIWSETQQRTAIYYDNVTVTYQINPEKSTWIYSNVTNYKSNLVSESLVASGIKSSSKALSDTDATNRSVLEPAAMENVQRALAEKYGISQATVERRAKKEKWTAKRRQAEGQRPYLHLLHRRGDPQRNRIPGAVRVHPGNRTRIGSGQRRHVLRHRLLHHQPLAFLYALVEQDGIFGERGVVCTPLGEVAGDIGKDGKSWLVAGKVLEVVGVIPLGFFHQFVQIHRLFRYLSPHFFRHLFVGFPAFGSLAPLCGLLLFLLEEIGILQRIPEQLQ